MFSFIGLTSFDLLGSTAVLGLLLYFLQLGSRAKHLMVIRNANGDQYSLAWPGNIAFIA